jgi:hypothetical protein
VASVEANEVGCGEERVSARAETVGIIRKVSLTQSSWMIHGSLTTILPSWTAWKKAHVSFNQDASIYFETREYQYVMGRGCVGET